MNLLCSLHFGWKLENDRAPRISNSRRNGSPRSTDAATDYFTRKSEMEDCTKTPDFSQLSSWTLRILWKSPCILLIYSAECVLSTMSSTPSPPLLPDSVQQAMDAVCWELNNNRNNTQSSTQNWKLSTTPQRQQPKESSLVLLFGFTATRNSNDETPSQQQTSASNNPGDNKETSSCLSCCYLATFYMAYSTWDGRNLYLDDITLLQDQTQQQQQQGERTLPNDLIECFHQALARTAVRLGCSRFTWQHYDHQHTLMCPTIDPQCPPETLGRDWWNLHWQADSIRNFLSQTLPPTWLVDKSTRTPTAATTTRQDSSVSLQSSVKNPTSIIEHCLQKLSTRHASLRLSLAKEHDLDAIGRLVQGLADFDKEPDAVHITTDHYRCDGFLCHQPLFYCILINAARKKRSKSTDPLSLRNGLLLHWLYAFKGNPFVSRGSIH